MTAACLAILSSVFFGAGDFLGGFAAKRVQLLFVVMANQIAALATMLLAAILLSNFALSGRDFAFATAAGLSTAIGVPTLYRALSIGPMSVVAPVTALVAIVLPVLYGILSLGETPSGLTIAGFVLGGLAVFLLGGGDKVVDLFKPTEFAPARTVLRAFAYSLAAGLCIATFYVVIKQCSAGSGLWPIVAARVVSTAAIAGVAGVKARKEPVQWPSPPFVVLVLLSGSLDGAANGLYLLAARGGDLGVAATITSLYPATTILLARYLVGERLSLPQAIGVFSALAAIVAIVAPL
jgi:drug/metabolite transporter (DMT)-like permease